MIRRTQRNVFIPLSQSYIRSYHCTYYNNKEKIPSRKIYPYGAFPTPAKGAKNISHDALTLLQIIKIYKNSIEYHAKWRTILFFLLLGAYYRQDRHIEIYRTDKQHGKGRLPLVACHSSLLPGLKDSLNSSKNLKYIKSHCYYNKNNALYKDTILDHINNMTVCLPQIVNSVDCYLEGPNILSVYRQELLTVLNKVSKGYFDPFVGMEIYFNIMNEALRAFVKLVERKETDPEKKQAFKQIAKWQRNAILSLANKHSLTPKKKIFEQILQKQTHGSNRHAFYKLQKELTKQSPRASEKFLKRFDYIIK